MFQAQPLKIINFLKPYAKLISNISKKIRVGFGSLNNLAQLAEWPIFFSKLTPYTILLFVHFLCVLNLCYSTLLYCICLNEVYKNSYENDKVVFSVNCLSCLNKYSTCQCEVHFQEFRDKVFLSQKIRF